jgi:hypothetical protein
MVDWGDSTTSEVTSFDDADITHSYAASGDYTVKISGLAESLYLGRSVGNTQIIEVVDLGNVRRVNLEGAFADCYNLVSFAGGDTSKVPNMSYMFGGTKGLTTLNTSNWNLSLSSGSESVFEESNPAIVVTCDQDPPVLDLEFFLIRFVIPKE